MKNDSNPCNPCSTCNPYASPTVHSLSEQSRYNYKIKYRKYLLNSIYISSVMLLILYGTLGAISLFSMFTDFGMKNKGYIVVIIATCYFSVMLCASIADIVYRMYLHYDQDKHHN